MDHTTSTYSDNTQTGAYTVGEKVGIEPDASVTTTGILASRGNIRVNLTLTVAESDTVKVNVDLFEVISIPEEL